MLAYLSRYTHRVAISNSRLVGYDAQGVTFKWKDYRAKPSKRYKTMRLASDEFMPRFLLHVLPSGLHRIRHFWFFANPVRAHSLAQIRALLVDDTTEKTQPASASLIKHRERKPVVVYGDLCLGFNNEMCALMAECDTIKVDGLNCIDCLLGGRGKLLDVDPDHHFFFLTPAFIEFSESLITGTRKENRRMFNMLKGIILVDSLNDMERYQDRINHFSNQTGLPVLDHRVVGLSGLKNVIEEALQRSHKLLASTDKRNVEVLCSILICNEHKPHNCHRRLVVDYLNEHWDTDIELVHLI